MKKEKNNYSWIQYILWLVAGSEISVLKKCPNEYNRHANIGLMIIITSLFAGMTAFVAGSTFEKENTLGVVIFAFIWAFLIFSLDRSMVNSIKKDPTKPEKSIWGYFAPRLFLAIILSFFMSIPIEHIVFKEKIEFQMNENNKNNWLKRQEDLNVGYNTKNTQYALNNYTSNSQRLEQDLQKSCADCPLPEYKSLYNEGDRIKSQELPKLNKDKNQAEFKVQIKFGTLQRQQTDNWNKKHPPAEQVRLISPGNVLPDADLKSLYVDQKMAQDAYNKRKGDSDDLFKKAQGVCDDWKNGLKIEKLRVDSLKMKSENLLISNNDSIRIQSDDYKKDIEAMQGFDTQFVTLFLMPDAGVQFLKWLIFMALLVIEILPTFLKLKTPIGQYDWEIYKADKETEISTIARIQSFDSESAEIEKYKSVKEVEMNKELIDKVVLIEEKLANQMLDQWETQARKQIENDIAKS